MSEQAGSTDSAFWTAGEDHGGLAGYRALVELVDGGVVQCSADGRLVALDETFLELTNDARDRLLGEPISAVFDSRTDEEAGSDSTVTRSSEFPSGFLADNASDTEPIPIDVRTADGHRIPCTLRLKRFSAEDAHDPEYVVGVVDPVEPERDDEQPGQSLAVAQSPLSSVLEEADIGVFVLDSNVEVAWINETTERYFGLERSAVIGRDKRAVITEQLEDRIADFSTFRDTVTATYEDNNSVEQFECRILSGDDREPRWLEHRSHPIESGPYAGGRIELYYDVTDRRRRTYQLRRLNEAVTDWLEASSAEEAAERACHSLRDVLDLEINGVFRYEEDAQALCPIALSEPGNTLFDEPPTFDRGEGIAWRVYESGTPEIYDDVRSDPDVYNHETPIRSEIILPIGEYGIIIAGSEQPGAFDRGDLSLLKIAASSLESTFNRIDNERQLERRKSELETELSEILGRISDAFYALDEDCRFTHVNDRAAALLQRRPEQLRGRHLSEVYDGTADADGEADRIQQQFHDAMASQERVSFESYDATADAWLEFNAYPSETGLSVYFRDVTERKTYERQLEASNERLEQFAYAASHDLQEPLRMVSSYLRLIEQRYGDDLDADGMEFLEYATDGADRMRAMIDGLLTYSRVETQGESLEPVDLEQVLANVREDMQFRIAESNAEVTTRALPTVRGDSDQLRQVFQNLLSNAIEYSGDEPPTIDISSERAGSEWHLAVTDHGIGIESDDTEQVFEVFQRLHSRDTHDGTGIGLAVCKRIVERHGGEIGIDSEPGVGTTISVTLPAVDSDTDQG